MPSSPSTSLRLELQATGENINSWGTRLNTVINLTEEALSGVLTKSLTGDVTLTSTNYTSDEARHMVLVFTDGGLSGAATVTIPDVQKVYIVRNAGATHNVILTAGGATNATVGPGEIRLVYCDGATAVRVETNADLAAVAAIDADVTTVAGIDTDVSAVAAIDADVTTVAGIAANVTTVATNSANVTAVAGNATNINTVAGISADVTTVAGDSAAIQAVAADATDIGTVATNIADVNTVAGANTNIGTVATNIANVNTVATNVSDVNTVAGISANVTTVAGISADITTAATNVADITNFADVYLGAAASDPATRADSSALQAGDLYFNTASDALFVYDGAAWQAAALDASSFVPTTRTLTAGTGLTGGGNLSANRTFAVSYGTTAGTAAEGNDTRITGALQRSGGTMTGAVNMNGNDIQSVGQSYGNITALVDGATITPDFAVANNFSVTLGGNRTLANPSNLQAGQSGFIVVTQDGTGSRTLSFGSYWKFSGGTAPTLTTAASAVDVLAYYVESGTRISANLLTDTK